MNLQRLTISNFKGIQSLTIEPRGQNVRIYGDNETGKTTICDAYTWLLFGKNSDNAAKFSTKTLDTRKLEYYVEAEFNTNSPFPLTLRRHIKEKWRVVEGEEVFAGDTTEYTINGVPKSETEYKAFIKELCPEELFRTVTDPFYLADPKEWQRLRGKLLELCALPNDEKLMQGKYAVLPSVLRNINIDEYRKKAARDKKALQQEIDGIQPSITQAEALRRPTTDIAAAKSELELLTTRKNELLNKIAQMKNFSESAHIEKSVAEARAELSECNSRMNTARMEFEKASDQQSILAGIDNCNSAIAALKFSLNSYESSKARLQADTTAMIAQKDELLAEYNRINDSIWQGDTACPTCNQQLPYEKIAAAKSKFAADKQRQLDEIVARGKSLAASISKSEETIEDTDTKIKALVEQLENEKARLNQLMASKSAIIAFDTTDTFITLATESQAMRGKISTLESQLNSITSDVFARCADAQNEANEIDRKSKELNTLIAAEAFNIDIDKQIAALENRNAELYSLMDDLDGNIALCDDYCAMKNELLENAVNDMFSFVQFRLFENNKVADGGKECCIPTHNGTPYSDCSLSTKIRIGLEIIKVFSEATGFHAPIIVDNAECATSLPTLQSQVIETIVAEQKCVCGGSTGNKQQNKLWKCKRCGMEFEKAIKVEVHAESIREVA